jgi:DNA-binding IclR family transcriptional regulator
MSSLVHGVHILRCFSRDEPALRLSEISRRLGLSKSNTHRLLTLLVEEGLLRRAADSSKYRLSLGLFELGMQALSDLDVRPALPAMTELGQLTGETVLLGVLDETAVVYVQQVESPRALRISHGTGLRAPIHCTATGKALLAWRSEAEIERVIRQGLPAHSERTITDPARFRKHLADVRRLGYAVNDQEREPLIRSVAAPVWNASGAVVAALTVAGPSQRLARAAMPALAARVADAAARLTHDLRARSEARPLGPRRRAGPAAPPASRAPAAR